MNARPEYTRMASCKREMITYIKINQPITPLGAIPHPHDANAYLCGFIKDTTNTLEDRRHCVFLGPLMDIGGQFRYRCKAFDKIKEAFKLKDELSDSHEHAHAP